MRTLTTAALILACLTPLAAQETGGRFYAVVEDAFHTAEYRADTRVKINGAGKLVLTWDGDGRISTRTIAGPTEGWQPLSLHLRANPGVLTSFRDLKALYLHANLEDAAAGSSFEIDEFTVTPLYQHHPPKIDTPPVIDGDLSDACWDDAAYIGDPWWGMYNAPRDARAATHVWCAYDDEHLYVAFRCMTPRPNKLRTRITEHDGNAWTDDSAEIFLNPSHDHQRYYEYIVTPKEVVFDSKWFREGGVWQIDWHYFGDWKVAIEEDAWVVEIALDLRSYEERDLQGNPTGYMPLPTGDVAGILFSRNDRVLGEGMSWADCRPGFHEVHQYGHLIGFKPNYVAGYRKYALRAIGELEARWNSMYIRAGRPGLVPSSSDLADDGTQGIAEALASLRSRAEAERPDFDEWVAIGQQIKRMDKWLDRAETVLAWDTLRENPTWRPVACDVAVASPLDFTEVRTAAGLPESLHVPKLIRLSAARGEYEPLRLFLMSLTDEPITVSFPMRFATRQGRKLPFSVLFYMEVGGRNWPAALVPVNEVTLEPGRPQEVWCVIEVPRTAEPGVYRGALYSSAGPDTGEIELTVRDFALPRMHSLPVAASFSNAYVSGEGKDVLQTTPDRYWRAAEQLLRHRVTPAEMLADFTRWQGETPDFSFAEEALARAETIGYSPRALMLAGQAQLRNMTDRARKLEIAQRHWRGRLGVDLVPVIGSDHGMTTEDLPSWALEQSVVPGLWEWRVRSDIEQFGTWAMPLDMVAGTLSIHEPEMVDRWRAVSAAGKHLAVDLRWSARYVSGPGGVPSFRMAGWIAWKYRIPLLVFPETGFVHGIPPGWTASGLLSLGPGGGHMPLPYPAPVYDPPAPTMQLELLRDGLEDYEYLKLLSDLNRMLSRTGVGRSHVRLQRENSWIFTRHDELIQDALTYTDDPEVLMAWRDKVAVQIERTRAWLRAHGQEGLPGD